MSNLYSILAELCAKNEISGYKMCKDLGIQPSIMTDLKKGRRNGVNADTADKLASYFGVTVSFLLGKESSAKFPSESSVNPTFDDFTYAMHNESQRLTEEDKSLLLALAKQLSDKVKNGKTH